MSLDGAEIGAWIAALAGGIALLSQAINALKKRQQERDEIEEALDHSPEVRHQLELGNVGEAVKHLNVIIESQARHIRAQDERQKVCDDDIVKLKTRNEALETEAQGWEARYLEAERKREETAIASDRRIAALQREIEEVKRTFARSLAQLRAERNSFAEQPGEET